MAQLTWSASWRASRGLAKRSRSPRAPDRSSTIVSPLRGTRIALRDERKAANRDALAVAASPVLATKRR